MDKNTLIGGLAVAVIALIAYLFLSGQDTSGNQVAQADGFGPNGGEQVVGNAPVPSGEASQSSGAPVATQRGQQASNSAPAQASNSSSQAATVNSVNGPVDDIADTPMAPAQLIAAGSYSNCQILYTNNAVYNGGCNVSEANDVGDIFVTPPGGGKFTFTNGKKGAVSKFSISPGNGIIFAARDLQIRHKDLQGSSSTPNCVTAGPDPQRDGSHISICAR